ncbi:hypothetical protein [Salinarchaeum sp. Harcht-Bsk1]|uniref:hypothetical protein n=1 Tax=Salinarchaeum sp. Harcht-Bsk1 TaxID=1333523 RepID=UPI000677C89D|nr:hypothetical protein [Salinarchaeum sp. Harcht-Bsk1]
MESWNDTHLQVVSTMVREPVAKTRHVQRQTLKGWCGGYDGDQLDEAIDDLVAIGLVREKGRGTITLRSVQAGKRFLEKHDEGGDYVWFY